MKVDIFNIEQWEKPTNLENALNMIRKIKTMFPIFGIIYQSGDITGQAEKWNYNLTDKEIQEIATYLDNNHDCDYGITWEHIDDAIKTVMSKDDEPGMCSNCNGSGEGMHDGTICMLCGGSGVEKERE